MVVCDPRAGKVDFVFVFCTCSYSVFCIHFSFCYNMNITRGSFVLHLLVGLWWDKVQHWWDQSQLLPSQTSTVHPSGIIWLILISVPKRKFGNTNTRQNLFKIHLAKIPPIVKGRVLVTSGEKWVKLGDLGPIKKGKVWSFTKQGGGGSPRVIKTKPLFLKSIFFSEHVKSF